MHTSRVLPRRLGVSFAQELLFERQMEKRARRMNTSSLGIK
jgi:hypothetical protein